MENDNEDTSDAIRDVIGYAVSDKDTFAQYMGDLYGENDAENYDDIKALLPEEMAKCFMSKDTHNKKALLKGWREYLSNQEAITLINFGYDDDTSCIQPASAKVIAKVLKKGYAKELEIRFCHQINANALYHIIEALDDPKCNVAKFTLTNLDEIEEDDNTIDDILTLLGQLLASNNSKITSFTLRNSDLKEDELLLLVNSIASNANPKLEHLNLSGNEITDEVVIKIAGNILIKKNNLKNLEISPSDMNNVRYMDNKAAIVLAAALEHKNCRLETLDISNHIYVTSDVTNFIKKNSDDLQLYNYLSKLDVKKSHISNIAKALNHPNCKIKSLNLSRTNINQEGVSLILNARNHAIEALYLEGTENLGLEFYKVIANFISIPGNKLTHLQFSLPSHLKYTENILFLYKALLSPHCVLSNLEIFPINTPSSEVTPSYDEKSVDLLSLDKLTHEDQITRKIYIILEQQYTLLYLNLFKFQNNDITQTSFIYRNRALQKQSQQFNREAQSDDINQQALNYANKKVIDRLSTAVIKGYEEMFYHLLIEYSLDVSSIKSIIAIAINSYKLNPHKKGNEKILDYFNLLAGMLSRHDLFDFTYIDKDMLKDSENLSSSQKNSYSNTKILFVLTNYEHVFDYILSRELKTFQHLDTGIIIFDKDHYSSEGSPKAAKVVIKDLKHPRKYQDLDIDESDVGFYREELSLKHKNVNRLIVNRFKKFYDLEKEHANDKVEMIHQMANNISMKNGGVVIILHPFHAEALELLKKLQELNKEVFSVEPVIYLDQQTKFKYLDGSLKTYYDNSVQIIKHFEENGHPIIAKPNEGKIKELHCAYLHQFLKQALYEVTGKVYFVMPKHLLDSDKKNELLAKKGVIGKSSLQGFVDIFLPRDQATEEFCERLGVVLRKVNLGNDHENKQSYLLRYREVSLYDETSSPGSLVSLYYPEERFQVVSKISSEERWNGLTKKASFQAYLREKDTEEKMGHPR